MLDWADMKTRKATVPRHVVHRTLASETVILNIETGLYYGMDGMGARFFELLQQTSSVGAAVDALLEEVDETRERVEQDMDHYCRELLDLGLIELE
jgi:hypothetical protein